MAGKLTDDREMSASRLPGLMGFSKYSTPNDELQYSINAIDGKERPDIGNEAMAWGNTLEPVILGQACERLGIEGKFDITEPYKSRIIALQCSLDGIGYGNGQEITSDPDKGIFVVGQDSIKLDGPGVLEAKLTKTMPEETPHLARGPIQLQGQMLVTGHKWGAVCVLYQGIELRVFLFAPHSQTQNAIVTATNEFTAKLTNYVETGAIDWYPPTTSRELDRIYPAAAEKSQVELPPEAEQWAGVLLQAQADIREAEKTIDLAERKLKEMMGQSEIGRAGSVVVKWPMRNYAAKPARLVPAKEAYSVRQSTLSVKELS